MSLKDDYLAAPEPSRFLLAHCEKTLEEIKNGYRGATHSVNRCNAECESLSRTAEELRARCDSLEKARDEADAEIGKLQEAMDKSRKAYQALRDANPQAKDAIP